jgi:hypothetical protein
MAGKVLNFMVCSPVKLRSGLTGKCHAICHYSYNLPLAARLKNTTNMKKHLLILFGIVFLMACSNTHQKTKYNLKQTDWKNDKLIGKVKTLIQYKANVSNLKNGKTEKPRIEFKKEYTKFGMISFQEYYNNFKELKQKTKNEYDKTGLRIKSITTSHQPLSKTVQTNQYDTAGRPISVNIIYNETVHYSADLTYNGHGDLIKQSSDQNGEKTLNEFKYKYNKKGKVIWKEQIQNYKSGETEYLMTFKYDTAGNLIETTNKSDVFGKMKWINKYNSKDKLEKSVEYQNIF